MLTLSFNKSAAYIRQRLTENSVRVADKRVRFVSVDAYVAAGGGVMRDLFEDDDGGWLTDPALLDRLVDAKLAAEGNRIGTEGWKWVATAVHDLPWNVTNGHREIVGAELPMTEAEQARLTALQAEIEQIPRPNGPTTPTCRRTSMRGSKGLKRKSASWSTGP